MLLTQHNRAGTFSRIDLYKCLPQPPVARLLRPIPSDDDSSTKPNKTTQLSPTQLFENLLTSHVQARVKKPAPPKPQRLGPATFLQCGRTQSGEYIEPCILVSLLLLVSIVTFIGGTIYLWIQNVEYINATAWTAFSYVLPLIGGFWSAVWFVVKTPFVILVWLFAFFAGSKGYITSIPTSDTGAGNTTAVMSEMHTLIPTWAAVSGSPKVERRSTSTPNDTSPSGMLHKSWHRWGNGYEFEVESMYPFTRHNNSLPVADRCEELVARFACYWGEEMDEKLGEGGNEREGRGKEGQQDFDMQLGRDLAIVLLKHCG